MYHLQLGGSHDQVIDVSHCDMFTYRLLKFKQYFWQKKSVWNFARQTIFEKVSHVDIPLDIWDKFRESEYCGNTKVF